VPTSQEAGSVIAREKVIRAHRALLKGSDKLSYFEERGISAETVRAAWVGYDVPTVHSPIPASLGRFPGALLQARSHGSRKHAREVCKHEALFGRSASQDRQSRRRRYVQVRCCSPVRCEPLLRKSLCQDRSAGRVPYAEKGRWQTAKADEITRGGCSKRGQGVGRGSRMRVALSATLPARCTGRSRTASINRNG
jgi:hypothetical protein